MGCCPFAFSFASLFLCFFLGVLWFFCACPWFLRLASSRALLFLFPLWGLFVPIWVRISGKMRCEATRNAGLGRPFVFLSFGLAGLLQLCFLRELLSTIGHGPQGEKNSLKFSILTPQIFFIYFEIKSGACRGPRFHFISLLDLIGPWLEFAFSIFL